MGTLPGTIADHYYDIFGNRQPLDRNTYQAILAAMRVESEDQITSEDVIVMRGNHDYHLHQVAELVLEDGTNLAAQTVLPPDLPLGYHTLHRADGAQMMLIKAPARCHFDPHMRQWAWAVQLYALRSQNSWGQGDLSDLRRLARWSADRGAGAILINPIHATAPAVPQQTSPYFPTSRRFRSPLYLDVTAVGDPAALDSDLLEQARLLGDAPIIDRDSVWRLKREALWRLFQSRPGDPALDAYCREQGPGLDAFATYCAIAESHGADWRRWPSDLQSPQSPQVAAVKREHDQLLQFYRWIQWQLDRQLKDASSYVQIVQDLPIGVDPGGADAWQWQDMIANEVCIGAPPDQFNTQGQDWGLPPLIPHLLRGARYKPFIETIRSTLRYAGGLRIDHVMGLFRLFWIPGGASPAGGGYVRYPADDLLAIVALESHRAGAWIAGEDLGTVQPEVKAKLAENAMLSYRLMWFASEPPSEYPHLSMAAATTHDLPTVTGLWSGEDFQYLQSLGLPVDAHAYEEMKGRLVRAAGIPHDAPTSEMLEAAHRALARSPAAVAVANLDDAMGVRERINVPGTVTERANWSQALPLRLEQVESDALVNRVASAMHRDAGSRQQGS